MASPRAEALREMPLARLRHSAGLRGGSLSCRQADSPSRSSRSSARPVQRVAWPRRLTVIKPAAARLKAAEAPAELRKGLRDCRSAAPREEMRAEASARRSVRGTRPAARARARARCSWAEDRASCLSPSATAMAASSRAVPCSPSLALSARRCCSRACTRVPAARAASAPLAAARAVAESSRPTRSGSLVAALSAASRSTSALRRSSRAEARRGAASGCRRMGKLASKSPGGSTGGAAAAKYCDRGRAAIGRAARAAASASESVMASVSLQGRSSRWEQDVLRAGAR
mmetsp:Transcript_1030/g.3130  ORF Transcript_1030/g.3130 Transcript_1030/m.3130 type:complete len:288 (-) Transcript_1030:583-1446(-)